MKVVDQILAVLSQCIESRTYVPTETERFELKDLSTVGDWTELYRSASAFMNTNGGIIIIGINENTKNKEYRFTGFNANNESKLKDIPTQFTDERNVKLDLSEFINPSTFEIRPFRNGQVCVIYVEKLPDTLKYVFYKGEAYERRMTGDHKLAKDRIDRQIELRAELETARELGLVDNASVENLDIDKLNEYINRLNKEVKVETFKPDIEHAKGFLERKKFLINNQPTLLGMLVCGRNVYDFVQGRCQVDGFVTSPVAISSNKKVLKDNIIQLMESSIAFVFTNISTEITAEKGGLSVPEYPERLIRETINNALAHRDYSVDRFVNITIHPSVKIEIRNPGKFKADQLLKLDEFSPVRRIIPIPKAQNPRLADVLKSFDRWEGKGWGMASLTNAALDNQTDLPYYILYSDRDIGLVIPKGKILDNTMLSWLESFEGYINLKTNGEGLNDEEKTVLAYFFKSEKLNKLELYTIALTKDNNHFKVIARLVDFGLITKHPESPDLTPIYLVDRKLTEETFYNEIRSIFGGTFDDLPKEYKEILNAVYQLNTYGKYPDGPNASIVAESIYSKQHGQTPNVKQYNDYNRKVRKIVSWLASNKFLIKSEDHRPGYKINRKFVRRPSIFDTESE